MYIHVHMYIHPGVRYDTYMYSVVCNVYCMYVQVSPNLAYSLIEMKGYSGKYICTCMYMYVHT